MLACLVAVRPTFSVGPGADNCNGGWLSFCIVMFCFVDLRSCNESRSLVLYYFQARESGIFVGSFIQ